MEEKSERTAPQMIFSSLQNVYGIIRFAFLISDQIFRPPFRFFLILKEIEFAGVKSIPIIAITSIFLGMVFTLHSIRAFSIVRMEGLVGPSVVLSFVRELASGFGALIITGRVGAAYTSKIGTMKITEQLDVLFLMGISPLHYIVVPKIIALMIIMPLVYFFFIFFGIIGGIISAYMYSIDHNLFLKDVSNWVDLSDVILGVVKSSVFGSTIAITSCYFGTTVVGSAESVGEKTTESIVYTIILVFILNYLISALYYAIK